MSSLMWPWPERMVSGLKPTKSSWLAVVQKKHHNPHVWAEWFLFWCPENKNENGKQVPLLAAQNWYFGWDNWREVQARWSFCLLCLFLSFSSSCLSVLDISLELALYRKAGSYWLSEVSQSVIGGHWRLLEVIGGQLRSIQSLFRWLERLCGMGWLS